MKPIHPRPELRAVSAQRGFALVVTLSLMVLLSILAVGMLSLSVVELRSLSNSDSRAVARANALLALKIAIGELQASAGPDQRITAPGGVLGAATEQQMITGVWKSRKLGPNSSPTDFSTATKDDEFVRWLVSSPDRTAAENSDFAKSAPSGPRGTVDLVSAANLDSGAPIVQAAKIPLKGNIGSKTGILTGMYAYAVLDEGVKARINLGTIKPSSELANATNALGAGQRPVLSGISGIGELAPAKVNLDNPDGRTLTGKMVSLPTAEFAYGSPKDAMKRKVHDLTSSSIGVLADVANGGLKKDINLLAEMKATNGLPAEYAGRKMYEQSFSSSIVSDPSWDRALAWASIFNSPNFTNRTVAGASVPTLTASIPPGWQAGLGPGSGRTAILSNVDPPGPVLLPSIAKIQMSFALAVRDIYKQVDPTTFIPKIVDTSTGKNEQLHGPWGDRFQYDLLGKTIFPSPYDYLVHMVYSPIITLHNPYNVPITFSKLRIEFVNVPFAFQVFRNGEQQTKYPVPFSRMFDRGKDGGLSKRFGLTLGIDQNNNPVPETLLPGEVKIYSPAISKDRTWDQECRAGVTDKQFWDWGNTNVDDGRLIDSKTNTDTSLARGQAGWFGARVGYDLDFLCPGDSRVSNRQSVGTQQFDRWDGIPIKKDDDLYVESTLIADSKLPDMKFSVEMTVDSSPGKKERASALVFDFETSEGLRDLLVSTSNPQADPGKKVIRWPKGTDRMPAMSLYDHSSVRLRDMANTRPFALFSAYAKTTAGGDPSGEEGLWVAKPFSFQNHTSPAISQNLIKNHPSHFSHDLAVSRFPESGGLGIQDLTYRGKFISGHSTSLGRHFGTLYDVPLAPMQSLVSLNVAQLAAGTSLPHFSAPVGNSYAHPLISTSKVIDGTKADHSFLLNAALFDSYYCSGIQSHAPTTLDGDGKSRASIVSEFIASATPGSTQPSPLPDPHLKPYYSDGLVSSAVQSLLSGADAYKSAAALQVVEGAFNVNSVSVPAWKAVLSSMSGEAALMLAIPDSTSNSTSLVQSGLPANKDDKGARFSRFRLPNGEPKRNDSDGFWRGGIDLSEAQVTQLAEEIVKQVKERGPFLSMAEFVNRQIGGSGDLSMKGALQAAIDKSGINTGVSSSAIAGIPIDSSKTAALQMPNAAALEGDSAQGGPGYLMQSDILAVLGNKPTVRSDTFTIRAYGEALDVNGNVSAVAYCEAVVQRTPEFVDSQNKAADAPASLSQANVNFGRRFAIISMRWMSPSEI